MASAPASLVTAVAKLWSGPEPNRGRPHESPSFQQVMNVCAQLYPTEVGTLGAARGPDMEGVGWALYCALKAIGTPWSSNGGHVSTPEDAANQIAEAITLREVEVVHLCPLDLAGDFPALTFGPCEVGSLTAGELETLVQPRRLLHWNKSWIFDSEAFSRFTWLTVRESRKLRPPVGNRAMPFLYQTLDYQFGSIDPHQRDLPQIAELALLNLLLVPWEDVTEHAELQWRGFKLPWIYTANPDPFVWSAPPPRAETLSWEWDIVDDDLTGLTAENQRPEVLPIVSEQACLIESANAARWHDIMTATCSPMFNPLCAHFFVSGFLSEGIDEFVSHIIAIEAGLGLPRDHDWQKRPAVGGKRIGATERVARRAAALTRREAASDEYKSLYKLRSDFIHGSEVRQISSEERIRARRLAREVVGGIITAAQGKSSESRVAFLENLCP